MSFDWLKEWWDWLRDEHNRGALQLIGGGFAAVVVAIWAVWTLYFKREKSPPPSTNQIPPSPLTTPSTHISADRGAIAAGRDVNIGGAATIIMPLAEYEERQREREAEVRQEIPAAETEKRKLLEAQLATLEARRKDVETAHKETIARLTEAYAALQRYKDAVPPNRLESAQEALRRGESAAAESLFRDVLEGGATDAAAAAFELGRLAEDRVDFAASLAAYKRAAELAPGETRYLNAAGVMAHTLARYDQAKRYFERALAIDEKAFGPDHPEVATDVNNLGGVLEAQGDLAGARNAYERALRIDEKALGPDHPNVAIWVNNLGGVLKAEGDLAGARKAFEGALAIDEKAFGPDHPKVAIRVNNLGAVLKAEGDLAGARKAYERALAIGEKTFGPDHPKVAIWVNNLGSVLQGQGDLAGAKKAYERALRIDEKSFGPNHPNVAIRVNNLGSVLQGRGDLAGAKKAYERALRIDERAFGPNHPNVARDVNNLGGVLQDLGDLAGARKAVERALAIDENAFGPGHTNVAIRVNNLGGVLKAEGDLAGARKAFERALAIFEKFLGANHPNTVKVRKNLAALDGK